jgi:phenylacetate-coenzyme A ligase PaaK-like adenylate-forming protein
MKISPIVQYVAQKIGAEKGFDKEILTSWQLDKINQTLKLLSRRPYYQKKLQKRSIDSLSEMGAFPFTTARELAQSGLDMICVPQSSVARVVTLNTSGTTGQKKRVYFSKADQELTIDYFGRGMFTLVEKGQTMAVLLPCDAPGGVGQLICEGLERVGVHAVPFGLVFDFVKAADMMKTVRADALVGVPIQVLGLARYMSYYGISHQIKSVLLSVDHIGEQVKAQIKRLLGCEAFSHYGMTEMGLGGAIDCEAHMGYHIREADLYMEIIDPQTGKLLPDGQWGEVVFTTLTRNAMPLFRYRTGDISRIRAEKCECGARLKLLDYLRGRVADAKDLNHELTINMPDLDRALLTLDGVMDFWAGLDQTGKRQKLVLKVASYHFCEVTEEEIRHALEQVDVISKIKETVGLEIHIEISYDSSNAIWFYQAKRRIETV